ncbi:toll-like receptor 4 [Haliotis rufescens]|uniref:toll-like receptor 4 n=1 Tax=Haliotis rufescens TaxID=6454 RepID=UPI00201EFB15|nr:toll-like receptor 4 [Haliotis rufescens]
MTHGCRIVLWITVCTLGVTISQTNVEEDVNVPCGNVTTECFKNLCKCSLYCVSCTNRGRRLTKIPNLNPTIQLLNYTSNYLGRITRATFRNITQLKILFLRNNSITYISGDAFQDMLRLELLDLRYSSVPEDVLQECFYSLQSKIRILDVSNNINVRNITEDFVRGLTRLNIDSLNIEFCQIRHLNFSVFSRMKSLRVLRLGNNFISWTIAVVPQHLKYIYLHSNFLTEIPNLCVHTNHSQLQHLDIYHNVLVSLSNSSLNCLTALKYLMLVGNSLSLIQTDTFSSLPNLSVLSLNNVFRNNARLEAYAFNNSAIKTLYLAGIAKFIYFGDVVHPKALRGCTELTYLDLSYNTMLNFNDSFFDTLLCDLQKLEVLRMPRCHLYAVPSVISTFHQLTYIDLHGNRIVSLNPGVFNSLTKLKTLNLSENAIQVVSEAVFSIPIREQLSKVNLAFNDFVCTCASLWFVTWVKADKSKFTNFPESYRCGYPLNLQSTLLIDANVSEETCRISPYLFPIVYGLSLVSIVLIVVISIAYRLRWRIRYYIHMLRYKKRKQVDEERYIYDAFVVYCEADSRWVRNNIIPRIEEEANFKLCIHERDFIPGEYIVDNIVTNLNNSRNVIMVLSNSFILSSWCQFELALIQKRALEKDEGYLLVVLLENIEDRNMTSSLYALFQTTTYITWPDVEEDRRVFWMRLKQCLHG